MTELRIGAQAPAISLEDQTGTKRSLGDFLNRFTVLYFYPKDDTPGCTLEAQEFTKSRAAFMRLGATVVGVSGGDTAGKKKFCDKYDLSIALLADPDFAVSKRYKTYGEKSFMGRKFFGVFRKTFVLDRAGKVLKVYSSVKPEGHAAEVIKFIADASSKNAQVPARKSAASARHRSTKRKSAARKKLGGKSSKKRTSKK